MSAYEYKVVPAPAKGLKAKGLRQTQDRFANALETVMNDLGADGWEYLRADTLPCEEREGLMGKTTAFQHMLIFRRTLAEPTALPEVEPAKEPPLLEKPAPVVEETPQVVADAPVVAAPAVPAPAPRPNLAAE